MNVATEQLEQAAAPVEMEQVTPHEEDFGTGEVDWDGVNSELDEPEVETIEGDNVVLAEVVEAVEVPAVEPVAAAPEVTPPPAATYTPPPRPVAPAPTPEQLAAAQAAQLAALEAKYSLTEEESSEMFTNPGAVVPKLLAKMHQQALADAMRAMQEAVPSIVQRNAATTQVETEARTAFFRVNDDLAKPEFEDAVLRIGELYRQVNPTAPRDVAIQKVGELARVALGLPAKGAAPTAPTPEVPTATPFTPTRGGTGAGKVAPSKGMWDQLNSEFDESDGF